VKHAPDSLATLSPVALIAYMAIAPVVRDGAPDLVLDVIGSIEEGLDAAETAALNERSSPDPVPVDWMSIVGDLSRKVQVLGELLRRQREAAASTPGGSL
jgi:hypothetical protein